jgi:hypothetical protein
MKKITLLLSAFMCFSIFSFAQLQKGDINIIQQYFGIEKAALVQEYMDLTPSQDSAFWPVYNIYEAERMELGKRRIMLIDDYVNNLTTLTDTKATELVKEANAIDVSFKKLQLTYNKKMTKAIGAVKAAQFYQFESYINNVINLGIANNIPFVGELEKMHKK